MGKGKFKVTATIAGDEKKVADREVGKRNGKTGRNTKTFRYDTNKGVDKLSSAAKALNDKNWYRRFPELVDAAGNLSFANFMGMSLEQLMGVDVATAPIMIVHYVPTVGWSEDAVSAVNMAVQTAYTINRHANSGAKNYEPADQGMLTLAVMDIHGRIAELERLYGISNCFSMYNRALPRKLIEGLGFDYSSVEGEQANLLFDINRLIAKASSIAIPGGLSFLDRKIWLNSFVFKDSDSNKAGLIAFVPDEYWEWFDLDASGLPSSTNGTWLRRQKHNSFGAGPITWQLFVAQIDRDIDRIINSSSAALISGDILKAFGEQGLAKLGNITADYKCLPVYQPEMLPQIHNLYAFGDHGHLHSLVPTNEAIITNYDSVAVTQRNGIIIAGYTYCNGTGTRFPNVATGCSEMAVGTSTSPNTQTYFIGDQLIDLPYDKPTPDDVMVATRLHPYCTFGSSSSGGVSYTIQRFRYTGSEIVTRIDILTSESTAYTRGMKSITDDPTDLEDAYNWLAQFDWHPIVYYTSAITAIGAAPATLSDLIFIGDIYNFTLAGPTVFQKLHETALMSEFTYKAADFVE